jgi:undecaprenyl diphosphate synthase
VNWSEEPLADNEAAIIHSLQHSGRLPKHVAVIMDGNGRWAQERHLPRIEGHREGMESVRTAVKASDQLGVEYLTLYAFSMENWKRPSAEVRFLMTLLETYLRKEINELHENGVRIRTIGKTNALPKSVQRVLRQAMEKTADNEGLTLTLALSYGSRYDITRAVQMIALDVRRGKMSPEDLTEEAITARLDTVFLPDPDLIIRTSGEMRLSNFLLWEAAYSEIYVTETQWPAFRRQDFIRAIVNYVGRERRFGKTSAQIAGSAPHDRSTLQRMIDALR